MFSILCNLDVGAFHIGYIIMTIILITNQQNCPVKSGKQEIKIVLYACHGKDDLHT